MLLHLFNNQKIRNFRDPQLTEVKSLDEAIEAIGNREYVKLIVHDYNLRLIIRLHFKYLYNIQSVTQKGVQPNVKSTIVFHKSCKKSTPFTLASDICKHCGTNYNESDTYLSSKSNVIILRKIKYITHNNCGKANDPSKLIWYPNSYHGECMDAYCLNCHEKICFSCQDEDEEIGYSIVF